MRRTSRLLVVPAVLAATLSLPPVASPAGAAAVTCDGLTATIVGPGSGGHLYGTAGDDVIVTEGAPLISGLAGDDHICLTGAPASLDVGIAAGDGDDVIEVLSTGLNRLGVVLGTGDDVFHGGPEADTVGDLRPSNSLPSGHPASGRDIISTGAGDDAVAVGSGDALTASPSPGGEAVADTIDLGAGDDSLEVYSRIASGFSAVGGGGRDTFSGWSEGAAQQAEGRAWRFDATTDRVSTGSESWLWSSFERSAFRMAGVTFVGGPGDEYAYFDYSPAGVAMGAGDDTIELSSSADDATLLSGGPGRDLLRGYQLDGRRVTVDLRRGRISDDDGVLPTVPLREVERLDVALPGGRLTLVGTRHDDDLRGAACLVRAYGRGGGDLLRGGNGPEDLNCSIRTHFLGGPGDDRLIGSRGVDEGGDLGLAGADRLIGGRGHDVANGRGGRDLCRAEVRRHCER